MRRLSLMIAAASSGAGKTTVTLGLLRALSRQGRAVAAAKSGPDYIDPEFLAAASGGPAQTLDAFAMTDEALAARAAEHLAAGEARLLVVEGAMGLFDGADGAVDAPGVCIGASARVAASLGAPIILVVDAAARGQSALIDPVGAAAALAAWRRDAPIVAGVIINRVASERHGEMARRAIEETGFPVFGVLPRDDALATPSRHLGLVQARERSELDALLDGAADAIGQHVEIDRLLGVASVLRPSADAPPRLAPLGQRIAVASDAAFAFSYTHLLEDWRRQGAELSFFSPLEDAQPAPEADAIFLPGGYPELHGPALSKAARFREGVRSAAEAGKTIYGECGGYMALGDALTDADGRRWPMLGLLRLETRMTPKRAALGYRRLQPIGAGPLATLEPGDALFGHEFHYAEIVSEADGPRLFRSWDAAGRDRGPIGLRNGGVFGSFAHVIGRRQM